MSEARRLTLGTPVATPPAPGPDDGTALPPELLALSGELDAARSGELRRRLHDVIYAHPGSAIVIDVADVVFI